MIFILPQDNINILIIKTLLDKMDKNNNPAIVLLYVFEFCNFIFTFRETELRQEHYKFRGKLNFLQNEDQICT